MRSVSGKLTRTHPIVRSVGKNRTIHARNTSNIFKAFRGGGVYNMIYGATILTWEDIAQLAGEQSGTGYFIGSYIPASQDQTNHIKISKWIPIVNGQPGLDQGAQIIEITNLE